jgi:hypothetical protein
MAEEEDQKKAILKNIKPNLNLESLRKEKTKIVIIERVENKEKYNIILYINSK